MATKTYNPASGANSPVDGWAGRITAESFANKRTGAGTHSSATDANESIISIGATTTQDVWSWLYRGIILFDTSADEIPAGAIITSAKVKLYVTALTQGITGQSICLVASTPAANDAVATGDYANVGDTEYATRKTLASLSTGGYIEFDLNSTGIAALEKSGINKFGFKLSCDLDNSAPTWVSGENSGVSIYFADQGSNKPVLEITYTLDIVMEVLVGNYTYSGADIALNRGWSMVVTAGNYIYAGMAVALRFSGWVFKTKPTTTWTEKTKPSSTWKYKSK